MRFGYRSPQRSLEQRPRRRRLATILGISLTLVAGSVTAAAVAIAQEDDAVLIANDFEDGSYAPWGPRGGVTLASSAEGHDSAQSLSVSDRTANWQGIQTDVAALFEEGTQYTIEASVKLPSGTAGPAGIHFTVQATLADGTGDTYTWVGDNTPTTDGSWVQLGGTYTRPAGLSAVVLYVEAEGTTPFLIDDIRITGPPAPPTIVTLIGNDFEDDTATPWGPRGGVTLAASAEGHDSAQSLSVSDRTANWQGIQTDVAALFEEGVEYTIAAWVKLPSGTAGPAGIHFTMQATNADGSGDTYTWVGDNTPTTDGSWVQLGGTYTRPVGLSALVLYVEAEGTTPFLIDDIAVTGPATEPPGPPAGVIHNSDFESGLNGWGPREAGEPGHSVTVSDALSHGGAQSMLISGRDSQGDGAGLDITALTQPGVTYTLTAWVRFAPERRPTRCGSASPRRRARVRRSPRSGSSPPSPTPASPR